jgi:hypothetical protein
MLRLITKNARIISRSSSSSISIITAAVLAKHPTTSTCDADHVATTKPEHQINAQHNQKKKKKKGKKGGGKKTSKFTRPETEGITIELINLGCFAQISKAFATQDDEEEKSCGGRATKKKKKTKKQQTLAKTHKADLVREREREREIFISSIQRLKFAYPEDNRIYAVQIRLQNLQRFF